MVTYIHKYGGGGGGKKAWAGMHAANESHVIDWKGAKVVDTHPQYHQRCVLESWHIRSETTTMNRDDGSLPQAYNTLLNYPRKPHIPH